MTNKEVWFKRHNDKAVLVFPKQCFFCSIDFFYHTVHNMIINPTYTAMTAYVKMAGITPSEVFDYLNIYMGLLYMEILYTLYEDDIILIIKSISKDWCYQYLVVGNNGKA